MAETVKKAGKKPPTPRQAEIKRLVDRGRDKRTPQESARLDQLKEEERRDRFDKLGPLRTENAILALERLSNCGNVTSYKYTPAEVDRIFAAIDAQLAKTKAAFSGESAERPKFSL